MAQRMVILGGAQSGKSDLAHAICEPLTKVVWWGTGVELPQDSEWQQRLADLRSARPPSWKTLEGPWAWPVAAAGELHGAEVFVVDSLNLWLAAQLNRCMSLYSMSQLKTHLELEFQQLLRALQTVECPVVVISAEVGSGVVPSGEAGRLFRDLLGLWNRTLVAGAHHGVSLEAGRSIYWPGGLLEVPSEGVPLRVVDARFLRRVLALNQLQK